LSGGTAVAASAGFAAFTDLSIDKVGEGYTLKFTSSGLTDSPESFSFNISAGGAHQLSFSDQPTNTVAGAAISAVTVRIEDSEGNLTNDTRQVSIGIESNPGDGALSGTRQKNAVAGVATFDDLSIDKAGVGYTLEATSTDPLESDISSAFNITHAPADQLDVQTEPGGGPAGEAWAEQPVIRVLDEFGNLVADDNSTQVTAAIATGGYRFRRGGCFLRSLDRQVGELYAGVHIFSVADRGDLIFLRD